MTVVIGLCKALILLLDRIYPGETKTKAGFHWAGMIFRKKMENTNPPSVAKVPTFLLLIPP